MSDESKSLVNISDVLGLGKLADSRAANRLVKAIISGVGELTYPWRTKRNSKAQIEVAQLAESGIPSLADYELDIDRRAALRIRNSDRNNQSNRESIAALAIEDLRELEASSPSQSDDKDIPEDWVEYFWSKAETVSDNDMQSLWSRILARKATGEQISLRALDMLRTLSSEEAKIIERLAPFKVAIGPNHPYWRTSVGIILKPEVLFEGDERESPARILIRGDRVVSKDGSSVDNRCEALVGHHFANVLGPIGIYATAQGEHSFSLNWNDEPLAVQIGERQYTISGLKRKTTEDFQPVSFGVGTGFSQIGWEVFSLVKAEPNPEYVALIEEALTARGLTLSPAHHLSETPTQKD